MKIAIVNDVGLAVEAIRRIVEAAGHEVAWTAADGKEAVRKAALDLPELILMDLIMPGLDGVDATRKIMSSSPCAILVVTATIEGNVDRVFQAMGAGALDAVNTPGFTSLEGAAPLLQKIATLERLVRRGSHARTAPEPPHPAPVLGTKDVPPLVVIGSSTGGPKALADIFERLPAGFPGAIVVVQHVDAQFASGLASWLDGATPLRVRVAQPGDVPVAGTILVAATNDHLLMASGGVLRYTVEPREYNYRPSVDVFFRSVARHWPARGVAALLTGMGRDGAQGLLELRRIGWHTIAQDEATSVIYGMPRAAVEAGAAVEVLPDHRIAQAIVTKLTMPDSRRAAPPVARRLR